MYRYLLHDQSRQSNAADSDSQNYIRGSFLKFLDGSLDFRILSTHILVDIVLPMPLSARNLRYESTLWNLDLQQKVLLGYLED